jgi:hypothetical protein
MSSKAHAYLVGLVSTFAGLATMVFSAKSVNGHRRGSGPARRFGGYGMGDWGLGERRGEGRPILVRRSFAEAHNDASTK